MTCFPKLKLTYFDAAGRAEAIRLAFHIGGVPFVDERLSHEEFAKRKPTFVYGQVPVLEVDGVEMAQSQAILRFAGKLAGLYPVNDPVAALRVDEILGGLDELLDKIIPSMREQDAEKKKAMRIELAQATIPRYLTILDKRLALMKKSPVFQGDEIFIHELVIYSQLLMLQSSRLDLIPTDIADGHVGLMATANKMKAHPKVRQWNVMHAVAKPKIKLTYFDRSGRGDPIRLAFVLGGIPFEDERIDIAEMAKRKSTLPFGQLPVLEVDGQVLAQSLAILRYAGTVAGLYPSNDPVMALRVDELLSLSDDVFAASTPVFRTQNPEAKAVAGKTLVETTMPRIVDKFEKRIAAWGGPYAAGATMTIADLIVYGMVANLHSYVFRGLPPMSIDEFKNVSRVYAQVRNHNKVKAWLAQFSS